MDELVSKKSEGINSRLDQQMLDDQLNNGLRIARNIDKDNMRTIVGSAEKLEERRKLSTEKTAEDNVTIDNLIRKLESGELETDKKEYKQGKLEAIKGRNLSNLMLNAQKTGGDSGEMKKVKDALKRLEDSMTEDRKHTLTTEEIEKIQENYSTAIFMCRDYLKNKTSRIGAWKDRKTMVQKTMDRLLHENKLLTMGKTLFALEQPEEPINSGVELIAVARMYQLSKKMKTVRPQPKKKEEPKKAEGLLAGFFDFINGIKEQILEEPVKELKEVKKLSYIEIGKAVTDHQAYEMVCMFQSGKNKLSSMIGTEKPYSRLAKEDKLAIGQFRRLREALRDFAPDEVGVKVIKLGDVHFNLIQRDDNSLYLETNGVTVPFGRRTADVLHDLENDVLSNMELYESDDLADVVSNLNIDFRSMNSGDLIRSRAACIQVLSKKLGFKKTDFDNVSVEELKKFAVAAAGGSDIKSLVADSVKEANKKLEGKHINNMVTLELNRLTEQRMDVIDHIPEGVMVFNEVFGREIETDPDVANGWTHDEARIKSLVTDILYDPDTREADLVSDVDEAEFKKLKEEKGFDEDKYDKFRQGKRLRDILVKNVEGIVAFLKDAYLDEDKMDKGIISGMLDKLPLFAVDDGMAAQLKEGLFDTMQQVVSFINKEVGMDKLGDDQKKMMLTGLKIGADEVKKEILSKLESLDTDKLLMLGDFSRSVDDVVMKSSDNIQEVMTKCSEMVFAPPKEDKKKADNKKANAQNQAQGNGTQAALQANAAGAQLQEAVLPEDFVNINEEDLAPEIQKEREQKKEAEESKQRIEKMKSDIEFRKLMKEELKNTIKENKNRLKSAKDSEKRGIKDTIEQSEKMLQAHYDREKNELTKIMEDTVKGNKGQGLFIKNVMKTYFSGMQLKDKRSMIAYAVRNAKPVKKLSPAEVNKLTSDEKMEYFADILGGMFKGAGPLFQKMLQGIPTTAVPKGIAKAIDEMKDSLLPIPKKVVQQHMDGIVKRSNGRINKIVIDKSLGAASVGQAFLCRISGPGITGEQQVVVKILRPDVRNRMKREYEVMHAAALKTDKGMQATFEGTFKRVEEELDLTIEAGNVQKGQIYDKKLAGHKENNVKAMKLGTIVDPTADCMVIQQAPGTTVKKYMSDTRDKADSIINKYCKTTVKDGKTEVKRDKDGKIEFKNLTSRTAGSLIVDRLELEKEYKELEKRQKYLTELAEKWVTEGIFGAGFYHGDLHAGNMMIDSDGVTVIDFGNATQLNAFQQEQITKMMLAAGTGEVNIFLEGFKKLLEKTSEKEFEAKKEELTWVFKDVLTMGDSTSTAQRIAVALARAQEVGLELPPAIANFSSCQIRLQNTIDDMNKILLDMNSAILAMERVNRTREEDYKDELFENLQRKGAGLSAKSQYMLAKKAKVDLVGMDRESFFELLNDEDMERRQKFILDHIYTPASFLDVMEEMYNSKKKTDVSKEFAKRAEDEDYFFEQKLLRTHGFSLSRGQCEDMFKQLSGIYTKNKLPKDKDGKRFTSVKEAVNTLAKFQYDDRGDVEEIDVRDAFKPTELDKALKTYLDAVKNRDKITEERMKEIEDKLWTEYENHERTRDEKHNEGTHTNEFGEQIPRSGAGKTEYDIKKGLFVIFPEFHTNNVKGWSKITYEEYFDLELKIRPCYADDKYGADLMKATESYKDLLDKAVKYFDKGGKDKANEIVPPTQEEMLKARNDIGELYVKASSHMLDRIIDSHKKMDLKGGLSGNSPKDFLDVMGEVIDKKKYTAAKRFGMKSVKYLKGF